MSVAQRPSPLAAAARALHVDSVTAEVIVAWRRQGVDAILVKGPSVATWLYGDEQVRSYGDSDLLVAPRALPTARVVLRGLGFAPLPNPPRSEHATSWWRERDHSFVDVHLSLWGAAAPPQRQYEVLRRWSEPLAVGGELIPVPTLAGRALLIAVHAAQHVAPDDAKPVEDLRRALTQADAATWRQAAALADELGLVRPLIDGLAKDPAGQRLMLELPETRHWLQAGSGAVTVARVMDARGWRARTRTLTRIALPDPDAMRWWSPLARRGWRGLAAAYVVRAVSVMLRALPSVVAWRRDRTT
jgi:hypothetical protein